MFTHCFRIKNIPIKTKNRHISNASNLRGQWAKNTSLQRAHERSTMRKEGRLFGAIFNTSAIASISCLQAENFEFDTSGERNRRWMWLIMSGIWPPLASTPMSGYWAVCCWRWAITIRKYWGSGVRLLPEEGFLMPVFYARPWLW